MPYYRITWEGYQEGEFTNEEEAKESLIDFVENGEVDHFGRDWTQLISVEQLEDDEE
jgi:hypothetical protein